MGEILCSVHFDESSFTMRQEMARELGIKAVLKPDAVPSIDIANNAEESTSFSKCEIGQVRGIIDYSFVIQERSPGGSSLYIGRHAILSFSLKLFIYICQVNMTLIMTKYKKHMHYLVLFHTVKFRLLLCYNNLVYKGRMYE